MRNRGYIKFSKSDIAKANETDLYSLLMRKGEHLEPVGKEYKLIYHDSSGKHDSIHIDGNQFFDHKNQYGGGAIKFMQEFYDMDFKEAVITLLEENHVSFFESDITLKTQNKKNQPTEKKSKQFELPRKNPNMHRAMAYLNKSRYINRDFLTHFANNNSLYESREIFLVKDKDTGKTINKEMHNVVFVGLDENGNPRQASARSTITYGKPYRQTIGNSDTRYSFSHFGTSNTLYVFEAPIDMMSYLTLHCNENWQQHSYIAMNGLYEKGIIHALGVHSNLDKIILCVDNDEGGIEATDRLKDILKDNGYNQVYSLFPKYKDWNEDLKALHGIEPKPSEKHLRKEEFISQMLQLNFYSNSFEDLSKTLYATYKNGQYQYLAESALSGASLFIKTIEPGRVPEESKIFEKLKNDVVKQYKPYTDRSRRRAKEKNLDKCFKETMHMLKNTDIAKLSSKERMEYANQLFNLANKTVRLDVEITLNQDTQQAQQQELVQEQSLPQLTEPSPEMAEGFSMQMTFGG